MKLLSQNNEAFRCMVFLLLVKSLDLLQLGIEKLEEFPFRLTNLVETLQSDVPPTGWMPSEYRPG